MIKNVRKIASRWYITMPLSLMMLVFTTSCGSGALGEEEVQNYSGEELFKSIFFATGDLANQLSSQKAQHDVYLSLDSDTRQEVDLKIGELMDHIKTVDPSFFEDFKTNMYTKNHQKIKASIEDASKLIYDGLKEVFPEIETFTQQVAKDIENGVITTDGELDENKLELRKAEYESLLNNNIISGNGRTEACSLAVVCVVYFALAAHNTVAVTALAAVALAAALWVGVTVPEEITAERSSDSDPLQFEIMVNEISTSL